MEKPEIIKRTKLLFLCLQYSSKKTAMLTTGERIVINQEIGQLVHKYSYSDAPYTPIPEKIEAKIKEIDHLIHVYDFKALNPFPYDLPTDKIEYNE